MSDLSALMKIAPSTAGYMVGQNQGQARQSEALKQQELQAIIQAKMQEAQQAQQMNPLLLEKARLGNQGLQAGLGGIEADSLQKTLDAQRTQQTNPGVVESTNALNKGKVRDEKVKDVEGINNFFITAGSRLKETPPALRMQALVAQMGESGIDPQSPQAQAQLQRLSKMDPITLPGYFEKLAQQTGKLKAQQNPAYHQAIDVANISAAERRHATDKQFEASKYTADAATNRAKAAAEAKAKSVDFWTSFYSKNNTAKAKYGALNAEAVKIGVDTPEGQLMLQMAEAIRPQVEAEINRPSPNSADLNEMGIKTNPPADIRPKKGPEQGQTSSGVKYKIVQ